MGGSTGRRLLGHCWYAGNLLQILKTLYTWLSFTIEIATLPIKSADLTKEKRALVAPPTPSHTRVPCDVAIMPLPTATDEPPTNHRRTHPSNVRIQILRDQVLPTLECFKFPPIVSTGAFASLPVPIVVVSQAHAKGEGSTCVHRVSQMICLLIYEQCISKSPIRNAQRQLLDGTMMATFVK